MNKIFRTSLIIFGIGVIIFLSLITRPIKIPQTEKIFVEKIEHTKDFYLEAEAMSLSLPILSDTIIKVYADSLRITLIELNKNWVIFVQTTNNYDEYVTKIRTLNTNIELLRMKYELEKSIRIFRRTKEKLEVEDNMFFMPDSKKSVNI